MEPRGTTGAGPSMTHAVEKDEVRSSFKKQGRHMAEPRIPGSQEWLISVSRRPGRGPAFILTPQQQVLRREVRPPQDPGQAVGGVPSGCRWHRGVWSMRSVKTSTKQANG